jgi:hypothetical protein
VGDVIRRDELEEAVAARRELGPEYEDAILSAFLEKVERRLEERGTATAASEKELKRRRDHQKELTLGAMALSIPLIAIAGGIAGFAGILAVCIALAVIAMAASRA